MLAAAGREVLIVEEGGPVGDGVVPHSPFAVQNLYRNGGLSPVLGRPNVAFVEGCCVGGSTEVNAGFWHRTPPETLAGWARDRRLHDLSPGDFPPLLDELEGILGIGQGPARVAPDRPSQMLASGAGRLQWTCEEIPRAMWAADAEGESRPGARRSMSRTLLPAALRDGGRLLPHCQVVRLEHCDGRVLAAVASLRTPLGRRPLRIEADRFYVCGGALQTPTILQRSGIRRNVGDTLRIHLMLKLVAHFDEALEPRTAVVPVCQVKHHGPDMTLGGSVCTPGFLSITLGDDWESHREALADWRRMALYYTLARASGTATVRPFPLTGEAFARYTVTEEDRRNLTVGFLYLCEAMFEAGARRVYPGLRGWPAMESMDEALARLSTPIPARDMSISSVHAFSSCPMGEDEGAAVDSFGRVRGFSNLAVADASILPTSPGVNPQATIMAMCLRNVRRHLEEA
jgi:choline dehydrogenase-like flavoprotein